MKPKIQHRCVPMMIPKAHIPIVIDEETCAQNVLAYERTAKCESELEKGHSGASTRAKTTVHDPYVRFRAAELCVYHDEAYRPICNEGKDDQEKYSHKEPGATHGVG